MTAAVTTPVNRRSDEQLSLIGVGVAVFVWGFGPLLVRGVHASAAAIVCVRLMLAQPFMIGMAYLTGGRISWDVMKRTCFPGLLFGTSMAAGFVAYQKTSIVNASLIGSMQPALLLVAAPFLFGTRTGARQLLFSMIAFAGVTAVVLGAGGTSGASLGGDMWAVLNLGLWSVYFVRVKQIRDDGVHAGSFIASVFLWAALFIVPISLFTVDDVGKAMTGRGLLLILGMVVGPGLLGHGLMTWSQKHLDIRIPSLLNLANPVVSTIGAWAIYSQHLSAVQLLGGVVVLVGLAGVVWDHRTSRAGVMEPEPT